LGGRKGGGEGVERSRKGETVNGLAGGGGWWREWWWRGDGGSLGLESGVPWGTIF